MSKRTNSVKSLQTLYTVVVGVALSSATFNFNLANRGNPFSISYELLLFVAFCVTLVPFFHGAMRHLDDAYLENESETRRDGVILFDFILLFFHGIVFVMLSFAISDAYNFIRILLFVLIIDIIWGVFVNYAAPSSSDNNVRLKWAGINFLFFIFFCCFLTYNHSSQSAAAALLPTLIASACSVRTVADYLVVWKFYFPDES